jgi:hypothetical protein
MKWKNKLSYPILTILFAGSVVFFYYSQTEKEASGDEMIMGVIADIHAGNRKYQKLWKWQ